MRNSDILAGYSVSHISFKLSNEKVCRLSVSVKELREKNMSE
jgi:hypothetical protein